MDCHNFTEFTRKVAQGGPWISAAMKFNEGKLFPAERLSEDSWLVESDVQGFGREGGGGSP